MKRLGGVLLALAAIGCATAGDGPARGKRVILTTFQPLYSLAWAVVGKDPDFEVFNLAPRKDGPHEFDVDDPAIAERIRPIVGGATAVVTLRSLPVSPHFDRLFAFCRKTNIRIVEMDPSVTWEAGSPRLPLIADPVDSARAKEGAATSKGPNPHVWLSLSHAAQMLERIGDDVVALDPSHERHFRANVWKAKARLREMKAEFEKKLSKADRVATLTEAFPYLTSDLGIDVADYILAPKGPDEVEARVKAANVKVVLAEEEPDAKVRGAVERAGAKVVVLRTLEEGWGEGEKLDVDGYWKGMRFNLETLAKALAP